MKKQFDIDPKLIDELAKSINQRKISPSDQSALKVIYLAIQNAAKKWTMALHDWRAAINRFSIKFEDRMSV